MPLHHSSFFARCTDLLIYNLILYLIVMLVFRINIAHRTQFFNFVMTYLAYGLMLLIEPVLLHFFGQTPGKWLWGLRVEGLEGRISLHEAWTRTLGDVRRGNGMGTSRLFTLAGIFQLAEMPG